MSVIRPPWISKIDFYRMPYNFCNRWCERCQLHEYCKVYQNLEKDKKQVLRHGNNPDSMGHTFKRLHEEFQKILKALLKNAHKKGIDSDTIENLEIEADGLDKEDPMYVAILILSDRLRLLIRQLEVLPLGLQSEKMHESIEIITWYCPLLLSKIGRAIASQEKVNVNSEEWYDYDDKTSAYIVYNGLIEVSGALLNMTGRKLNYQLNKSILGLSAESLSMANQIPAYFDFEIIQNVS